MKATELKIGDWVYFHNPEAGKETVRITAIHSERLVSFGVGKTELVDSLSPIPLTAEILEKNGWIDDGLHYDYRLNERLYLINAEYKGKKHKEIESVEVHNNISPDSYDVCQDDFYLKTVSTVHQLQHLLWALGLDDDLKI